MISIKQKISTAETIYSIKNKLTIFSGLQRKGKVQKKEKKGTSSYKGQYLGNTEKFQGMGEHEAVNGDTYEGFYLDGMRQGMGLCVYKKGSQYQGEWLADKWNGEGFYKYTSGNKYVGGFKQGKSHG